MAGKSSYTSVSPLDYMPFNKKSDDDKKVTIEQERAQWKTMKLSLKRRLRSKAKD